MSSYLNDKHLFLLINKNLPIMGAFYAVSLIRIISSFNWFMFWVFLEINTICFLPLILYKKTKKRGERALMYFIVQTVRSIFLLIGIIGEEAIISNWNEPSLIIVIATLLKIRAGIFFNWLYLLRFVLSVLILMLILSLQKLPPFLLIIYTHQSINTPLLIIILSSIILATFINMKQNNFKTIISVSSLSNIRWFLLAAILSFSTWCIYFIIYCLSLAILIMFNYRTLAQNYQKNNKIENPLLFLRLRGVPPFPGFFPKIILLIVLVQENIPFLRLILLISACVDTYVYLRFSYNSSFITNRSEIYSLKQNSFNRKLMLIWFMITTTMISAIW